MMFRNTAMDRESNAIDFPPMIFEPEEFPQGQVPDPGELFTHGNWPGKVLFRDKRYPGKTFIYAITYAHDDKRGPWEVERSLKAVDDDASRRQMTQSDSHEDSAHQTKPKEDVEPVEVVEQALTDPLIENMFEPDIVERQESAVHVAINGVRDLSPESLPLRDAGSHEGRSTLEDTRDSESECFVPVRLQAIEPSPEERAIYVHENTVVSVEDAQIENNAYPDWHEESGSDLGNEGLEPLAEVLAMYEAWEAMQAERDERHRQLQETMSQGGDSLDVDEIESLLGIRAKTQTSVNEFLSESSDETEKSGSQLTEPSMVIMDPGMLEPPCPKQICARGSHYREDFPARLPGTVFGIDVPDCQTFCQGFTGIMLVFYFFRPDQVPFFVRRLFAGRVSSTNLALWWWMRLVIGFIIIFRISEWGLPDGLFETVCDLKSNPWPEIWYYPDSASPIFARNGGNVQKERRW